MTVQKRQEIAMLGQFSESNTRFRICLCVCVHKHQITHQEELWCYLDSHLHVINSRSSFGASRTSSGFWSHDGGENSSYFWARLLKLNWGSASSGSHIGTWGRAASDFFLCVQVFSGLSHALKNAIDLCVFYMDLLLYIICSFFPWDLLWKDSKEMAEVEGKMKESMRRNMSSPWKQLHLFLNECAFLFSTLWTRSCVTNTAHPIYSIIQTQCPHPATYLPEPCLWEVPVVCTELILVPIYHSILPA